MRIAVIGGGPGGLYFAALAKQLDPTREITVWERNAPDDTFGFGVVFSDETLSGIETADPAFYASLASEFARWDDIDVRYRGEVITSGGHGFAAVSRRRLLNLLVERCRDLGVVLHHSTEFPGDHAAYDLVVASDGVHSATRRALAEEFRPRYETGDCRYIWLGTDKVFDAFTFDVLETEFGVMQAHAYPYDAHGSTLIIEMRSDVWARAGFTDENAIERIGALFADLLGGHKLVSNNSRWIDFTTVACERWQYQNVVLLGDAAHTAHFSIGSGTKLAMEDALALAACLAEQPDLDLALTAYEVERKPVVVSTQRAARASLDWFENLADYVGQEPLRFAFNLLTRSRRITYDNLRLRDPEFVARVQASGTPPMFEPFRLRGLELPNRIIVSPMDMYSAVDGMPNDFHLVHLGARALGGAGLVMTEMVCVSEPGRITLGCTGLYTDEQADAWARIVRFAHDNGARIGVQLGHSGRKGSTRLMWEGMDEPLPEDNWEVVGPSPLPYGPGSAVPRELTRADLDAITAEFVTAAARADRAGFDLLELHCAHGYLLSSFLSPLANQRTDSYGTDRLKFPLEVFDAVRAVWPGEKPMSVRISATDWHAGGVDADEAVRIARAFAEHGVDAIDVSTGQVLAAERPAYGRSYQTPYADKIRNSVPGPAVIAVGAISSYDDVNSILLAGRADLCAIGRAHLYDPHWTLHAAAEQDHRVTWPAPYRAGSRKPQTGRTDGPKPRLELLRGNDSGTRHQRWRPEIS
ncbi:salicylyl-CoA 5-hydroxylase [Longispora fulva]|uniref:Anthraniloyl-CoA monooxygenase n=1 Tax=Longispora fulva TaxID=619741 RepID=A0A8J7GKV2_9ACTN|nr:bifunctional salicylyl-CoA 5-hydroxylase/oxidoreductase [Longispora fulva]MBG6139525.1 anthraniloyl-CoA monooxygenase [Longispora fulva]GIG58092.1 salicylyl-CoA 5-hydroxylase [Longispora fulva]